MIFLYEFYVLFTWYSNTGSGAVERANIKITFMLNDKRLRKFVTSSHVRYVYGIFWWKVSFSMDKAHLSIFRLVRVIPRFMVYSLMNFQFIIHLYITVYPEKQAGDKNHVKKKAQQQVRLLVRALGTDDTLLSKTQIRSSNWFGLNYIFELLHVRIIESPLCTDSVYHTSSVWHCTTLWQSVIFCTLLHW